MKINEIVLPFPNRHAEVATQKSLAKTDQAQAEYMADRKKFEEFKIRISELLDSDWQLQSRYALHPEGYFANTEQDGNHVAYLDSELNVILKTPEEQRTKKQQMILQFCKQHSKEIVANTKKDMQNLLLLYKEIQKAKLRRPFTLLVKIKAGLQYYDTRLHMYSHI